MDELDIVPAIARPSPGVSHCPLRNTPGCAPTRVGKVDLAAKETLKAPVAGSTVISPPEAPPNWHLQSGAVVPVCACEGGICRCGADDLVGWPPYASALETMHVRMAIVYDASASDCLHMPPTPRAPTGHKKPLVF